MGRATPYEAERLLAATLANFRYFDADLALSGGADPRDLSIARLLNVFEVWLARRMTTVQWQRFQTELHAPPPEDVLTMPDEDADAIEGEQFMAFLGAYGGGG